MVERISKQKLIEMFDGRCAYCGKVLKFGNCADSYSKDHIMPKSKHKTRKHRFLPACMSCNTMKRNTDMETFRRRLGLRQMKREGKIRKDISLDLIDYMAENHGAKINIPYVEFFFESYEGELWEWYKPYVYEAIEIASQ